MSGDRILTTTVVPCAKQRRRDRGGLVGVAREHGRRDRNRVGREQPRSTSIGSSQVRPVRRRTSADDAAGRGDVGREILRQARRRLHQRLERFAIAHQMHEAAHRVGSRSRSAECRQLRRSSRASPLAADPDREDRLRRGSHRSRCRASRSRPTWRRLGAEASAVGTFMTRTASLSGSASSGFERGGVAVGVGVADDVDRIGVRPDRRQHGVEPCAWSRARCRPACRRDRPGGRPRARRCRRHW